MVRLSEERKKKKIIPLVMNNHQGTPEKTSSRFLEISFKDVHEDSLEKKKKLCSWIVLKVLKEKKISCRKRRD